MPTKTHSKDFTSDTFPGILRRLSATGAGAGARNNMGIAVVGGMTFATMIGIFLIPVFYVIVEKLAAAVRGEKKEHPEA